jgi:hypothetical protein
MHACIFFVWEVISSHIRSKPVICCRVRSSCTTKCRTVTVVRTKIDFITFITFYITWAIIDTCMYVWTIAGTLPPVRGTIWATLSHNTNIIDFFAFTRKFTHEIKICENSLWNKSQNCQLTACNNKIAIYI